MQMGHPRVRLGRTLTSALLCAVLTLSGCGGGDSGQGGGADGGGGGTPSRRPATRNRG